MRQLGYQLRNIKFILMIFILKLISFFYKKKSYGVLLIKLDRIGDFVLYSATEKAIREKYKNEGQSIFVSKPNDQLLDVNLYQKVITTNFENLKLDYRELISLAKVLRQVSFTSVIMFTNSASIFHLGLSWLISCKNRLMPTPDKLNGQWIPLIARLFFNVIRTVHGDEMTRNASFVSTLTDSKESIGFSKFEHIKSERLFHLKNRYMVVAPTASWSSRAWSIDKYAAVINFVIDKYKNVDVILCGAPNEIEYCEQLYSICSDRLINYVGKLALGDYVKLLRNAKLFLGNESGGAHLAYSLGVDVVCIIGGGHYGRFLPYGDEFISSENTMDLVLQKMDCFGCNWNCIYDKYQLPCIQKVDVRTVIEKVEKFLE